MQQSPDWDLVLRWAQLHRVTPLVHRSLRAAASGSVPSPVLERLEARFHNNARHNLLLTGELLEVLGLLEAHGIPALPYKGPALAACLYDNVALREFSDLDILVRERHLPAAAELLASRGYRPAEAPDGASAATPPKAERYRHNLPLVQAEHGVKLELHWQISFFYPLAAERLFEHPATVTLAGRRIPHFRPEDLLMILCVHGAKHFWKRLQWICDIAELCCAYPDLDWRQLTSDAKRAGGGRMVALGLLLARDVLGQQLAPAIADQVSRDRAAVALAARVRSRLFLPAPPLEGTDEQVAFYFGMRERLRDKLRYAIHLLPERWAPTDRDRALLPLPKALSFLHYVFRPIRLLARYCRSGAGGSCPPSRPGHSGRRR